MNQNKIIIKIALLFSLSLSSTFAYELPEVNIVNNPNKPEIVMFTVESVVEEKQAIYRLKWKTLNATDVIMTYIGRVEVSGTLDITKNEYNRGAITLTATKEGSNVSDSKTINKQTNAQQDAPIIFNTKEETGTMEAYRSLPYGRRGILPNNYRRRRY